MLTRLSRDEVSRTIKELKEGNSEERKKAAMKLGRIRDKRSIPILLEQLGKESNPMTKVFIIQSLVWIADRSVISRIEKVILEDEDNMVKSAAIDALASFKEQSSLIILNKIVMNSKLSQKIREEASVAIGTIEGYTA